MNKCLLEKLINNGTPDMYAAFAETIKQEIASVSKTRMFTMRKLLSGTIPIRTQSGIGLKSAVAGTTL